ncbi:MAG: protein kinase [Clostridia bacterium]|nr:protein kinase [Clostridia bacterium]
METRLIGKIVSRRFRIEEVIGRGGMSIVYRAFDLKTHQTVAVKVLREEYEGDSEYLERFEREADVWRRLKHPNIVNMIASGTAGGISYIAMEYVDGQTLKEIITEKGKLRQEEAIHYALQILAALGQAHQRGIIHRDIKPQNMMVTRNGQLKVTDFGIAGVADTDTLTSDDSVIGSVHYFSPEQAKGLRASAASDLYSVGVILYEMLCGKVPFEGESAVSIAMKHLMQEPTPISEYRADVSPALSEIVSRALKKNLQERYQSAEEMTRDLRRALRHPDGRFLKQKKAAAPSTGKEKEKRRISPILLAIIFVLFLLIGYTGYYLYQSIFVLASVPDVIGFEQQEAEQMIESVGLIPKTISEYSDAAEDSVFTQEPAPHEEIKRGETVTIRVSLGKAIIPRLVNYSLNEAMDIALAQGFGSVRTEYIVSELMKGTVVTQIPEAGSQASLEDEITLFVSGGRVIVPEVEGLREEEAKQRIEEVGLTVGNIDLLEVDSNRMDGIVLTQSLKKFSSQFPETPVDLSVGHYEKRRFKSEVQIDASALPVGTKIRITLVEDDGNEYDMYSAERTENTTIITASLRSETSGEKHWRLYLNGNFKEDYTSVLQ